MNATHVLPRPYIWGPADIITVSVEGRRDSMLAFGRLLYRRGQDAVEAHAAHDANHKPYLLDKAVA